MRFGSYKINPKHRSCTPTDKASIWIVSEWIEIQLFATASQKKWTTEGNNNLWSVKSDGLELEKIGEAPSQNLFFAKFCCDHNLEWHGYPIHPRGNDIPPENVLEIWRSSNFINKALKRRIQTGKFSG